MNLSRQGCINQKRERRSKIYIIFEKHMNNINLSGKITSKIITNKKDGVTYASCFMLMPKSRSHKRSYIRLSFINEEAEKLINNFKRGDYIEISGSLLIYERIANGKKVLNEMGETEDLLSKVVEVQVHRFKEVNFNSTSM